MDKLITWLFIIFISACGTAGIGLIFRSWLVWGVLFIAMLAWAAWLERRY